MRASTSDYERSGRDAADAQEDGHERAEVAMNVHHEIGDEEGPVVEKDVPVHPRRACDEERAKPVEDEAVRR